MFQLFCRAESFLNTSCVCSSLSSNHSFQQMFSDLLNLFSLDGLSVKRRCSVHPTLGCLMMMIRLGIIFAFWLLSRTPNCVRIHLGGHIYRTLSVSVVELSPVPEFGEFRGFKHVIAGSFNARIFVEKLCFSVWRSLTTLFFSLKVLF